MTRQANKKETEENQEKDAKNNLEFNGWTENLVIVVCFKEVEDMNEARKLGEDKW